MTCRTSIQSSLERVRMGSSVDPINSVSNMDPKLIQKFAQEFGGVTYVPENGGLG